MIRNVHITVPQELRAADGSAYKLVAVTIDPAASGTQVQATFSRATASVDIQSPETFDPQVEAAARKWLDERFRRWSR